MRAPRAPHPLSRLVVALLLLSGCEPKPAGEPGRAAVVAEASRAHAAPSMAAPSAEAPSAAAPSVDAPRCPMAVAGTTPRAVRLDGAAAIDFVTTHGDVAELRRQVEKKVKVHQAHHVEPGTLPPLDPEQLASMSPAQRRAAEQRWDHRRLIATATVEGEALEQGMRVKLTPAEPRELGALYAVAQHITQKLLDFGPRCPAEDEEH